MKLLIVESPAKAKTISKYLDNKYKVVASIGHIRDLPKNNKKAIDIEHGFTPYYEISKGKEKVVAEITTLAKKAEEVMLATDPDREGEAIAWHLKEACHIKKPKRVVFHEITERAVKEAVLHPRGIDEDLRKAQEARRVLDRLVGYGLSGLIWKKVRYGLSAGRVQSPALRIIMEREREIRAFVPKPFWVITADTETTGKSALPLNCSEKPETEQEADKILSVGKKGAWQVFDVTEEKTRRNSSAPFTTSTLQQSGSSRLGFSPSRTMRAAQRLYEAGHITYMRTDSVHLSKDATEAIKAAIVKNFGAEYYTYREFKSRVKNAQEAHEAIRPTHPEKENVGLAEDEKRLYQLIWDRTMASQMIEAEIMKTKIVANIKDRSIPDFHANGGRVISQGWYKAMPYAKGEEVELPKVAAGDKLNLIDIKSERKETEPPNRYSEAGLIKELEKRGIGRPSTYASTIQTLVSRQYVNVENKALVPTDTGDVVSTFLENNFAHIISDSFTAEMEESLDDIAEGKKEYAKTLKKFYTPFAKEIKEKDKIDKITNMGDADPKWRCPKCGGPDAPVGTGNMVIKLGKNGKFLSCAKFPDCDGARTIDGREMEGPKETGEMCPKCTDPDAPVGTGGKLIEREGRFGKFISCSKYPKCKFIKKDPAAEAASRTGVACPICKEGEMAERRGRFGIFYGCSNYPKCRYAVKAKPTGEICGYDRDGVKCVNLMIEGTKTIPKRCGDKTCPNHNPHKLV